LRFLRSFRFMIAFDSFPLRFLRSFHFMIAFGSLPLRFLRYFHFSVTSMSVYLKIIAIQIVARPLNSKLLRFNSLELISEYLDSFNELILLLNLHLFILILRRCISHGLSFSVISFYQKDFIHTFETFHDWLTQLMKIHI
jgi:hypothetical protein